MKKVWDRYAVLLLWLLFEAVAVTLWLTLDNSFYLFQLYIHWHEPVARRVPVPEKVEVCPACGAVRRGALHAALPGCLFAGKHADRGFWYYLFLGVFEAAVIHYAVAKLFGPLFFGRGWCGYACWTAMVLDLLPFKTPQAAGGGSASSVTSCLRCRSFFVGALFLLRVPDLERVLFYAFLVGNALYYGVGITLAFAFRDNRAFCKYLCPVTVFLKPASYYAAMRVKVDPEKCVSLRQVPPGVPMDVDMTDNARSRKNGTECILCMQCIDACPRALRL